MKCRLLVLLVCTGMYATSFSQSILEQMTRQQPDCQDVLINASTVFPKLYGARLFDSLQRAIRILQLYCGEQSMANGELLYINTLLHIQQDSFSINDISADYQFNQLLYGDYGNVGVGGRYQFGYRRYFTRLVQIWSTDLLSKPDISPTESFLCHLLAGDYPNPKDILIQYKEQYPELYALLQTSIVKEREEGGGVLNLIAGVWIPNRDLKILGAHPSLGFQVGGRGKRNEVLLTIQIRFLKAANLYRVRRQDSVYLFNHFLGGYIGLDYMHYFLHRTRYEVGIVAGTGYDGFDIAATSEDDDKDYLNPISISSLNINAGLRFNYYIKPKLSLGVMARYNCIWYKNAGGSSLRGQPVSIDFIIGR
jgi:hypothetical protein